MASNFWFGKTVLVAGATGFLGGWLVRRLLDDGAHVVTLVRSHKPESQFFMEFMDNRASVEWGSVADQRVIERIFERHPIDIFFHAAYGADVNRVLDEPLECFKSSALSTWQILDYLRKNRPTCISVISSTDKVYGNQPTPYREDMPSPAFTSVRNRQGVTRFRRAILWKDFQMSCRHHTLRELFWRLRLQFHPLDPWGRTQHHAG